MHGDGAGDDDAVLDWLSIAAVERVLAAAGVDMATLVAVVDATVKGGRDTGPPAAHGVA